MSFAPDSLKAVRRYIVDKTGVPTENISIRSARSNRGYHAGKGQIYGPDGQGDKDYSVRRKRDKRGLTNASSAADIKLPLSQLIKFVAYLVGEARAKRADLQEIIGPDLNGHATRWAKPFWTPKGGQDKSHEWHVHLGYPRDTEFSDRVAMLEAFFGPRSEPIDSDAVEEMHPDA